MSKQHGKAEPMDPSIHEDATPTPTSYGGRVCWGIKTLVAEVLELFPETPVEYSNIDGRGTALDVTFDFTTLDEGERYDAGLLLELLGDPAHNVDPRLDSVIVGDGDQSGQVLVSFRSDARTQDSREPFGLGDAWLTLTEEDQ